MSDTITVAKAKFSSKTLLAVIGAAAAAYATIESLNTEVKSHAQEITTLKRQRQEDREILIEIRSDVKYLRERRQP